MWIVFSTLLTVILFLGKYRDVLGRHVEYSAVKNDDTCKDEGVWILDGLIDCKYLYTKGIWGIDVEAKQRCLGDSLTQCCKTCKDLGFTKGSSGPKSETPVPSPQTAAPPPEVNVTKAPSDEKQGEIADPACTDNHVWLIDMAVDCAYLNKSSVYGLHSNPGHYCTRDAMTDCCHTCARLGFTKGSNQKPVNTAGMNLSVVATAMPKKAKSETVQIL